MNSSLQKAPLARGRLCSPSMPCSHTFSQHVPECKNAMATHRPTPNTTFPTLETLGSWGDAWCFRGGTHPECHVADMVAAGCAERPV